MREVVLFIAMSLDGYIAESDGGVGWLSGQDADAEDQDSYSEFAQDIDTVVMGWNTYHQIVTELSPGEWVYGDFATYVITHNQATSDEQITFTDENPLNLVEKLKRRDGKDIWISRRSRSRSAVHASRPHRQISHIRHSHAPGRRHTAFRGAPGGAEAFAGSDAKHQWNR